MRKTLPFGRPSKLTPRVYGQLIAFIRIGSTYQDACTGVGITYHTFRNWMKAGEGGDEDFFHFFHAIKKAEAEVAMKATECIVQGAKTDWRAAAWWLERRRPEEYSLRASRFRNEEAPLQSVDHLKVAKARIQHCHQVP